MSLRSRPRNIFWLYQLNAERLRGAKPEAIVLHPGPMNRGVEISPEVADGPQSCVLEQVTNGIAVRMALLFLLMSGGAEDAGNPLAEAEPARTDHAYREKGIHACC